MKHLRVDLANCYGIKTLQAGLDFSEQNAYAIYAPNGSMKTCLARTFKDVAEGVASSDRIFPARVCVRNLQDEDGHDLPKDSILVVAPYDEAFGHSEKTSTLLVDATLRKEFEQLHADIDKSKDLFLKALKEQSGSKKDLEKEVSATFTKTEDQFYRALIRVKDEVFAQKDMLFADVRYDVIFDDKVLAFLRTKDFRTAIADYITRYNELLAASTYFRKGIFNYYNAATIARSLADNGFFSAKHSINLNATERLEITSQNQLDDLIAKEKEAISQDKELKKKFAEIEKLITKNANVREFDAYLGEREDILPKLANIELFREELWKSYFKARFDLYKDLVDKYTATQKREAEIEDQARKQRTEWEAVIQIFNERFFVPFKLTAKNRIPVILGQEPILQVGFTYVDGADEASIEKDALLQVLSMGEKKALYILNIIFEVRARKKANQETLFIFDDIADSFDYKNKYAIIQYLHDIAEDSQFKMIILTHNFDFFRTIHLRLVKYSHCLMAERSSSGLSLEAGYGDQKRFRQRLEAQLFQ